MRPLDSKFITLITIHIFLLGACATAAPKPIGQKVRYAYDFNQLSVTYAPDHEIPDRYDKTVVAYFSDIADVAETEHYQAFAKTMSEPSSKDAPPNAEHFLAWMIHEQLRSGLEGSLSGSEPIDVSLTIDSTTWPNAVGMLLVGETIGIKYDFEATDANSEIVLKSTRVISPAVEPSAGSGGGLLGMALRSGESQHLRDLQRVARAASNFVLIALTGSEIDKNALKSLDYTERAASNLEQ